MQRLSSFSHAWTHVVQYRAQSLLPCPFYHKSQSSEASNHKARTKQPSFHSSLTLLLIIFFEKPSHRTSTPSIPVLFCLRLRKFHFPCNALRIGIFSLLFQPSPPSLSTACVPAVIPSLFPMCFASSQGRESCLHAETGERARGACVQRDGQGRERDDMHACGSEKVVLHGAALIKR